jgi:hypothetical protein
MSADQDNTGDYGYDLAHEVSAGLDSSFLRPRSVRAAAFHGAPRGTEPNGDLGYDSAHED